MRSTLRQLLVVLAVAVTLGSACGTLDSQDLVHDLRILGMRADPPEQLVGVPTFHGRDGGGHGLLDAGLTQPPGPSDGGGPQSTLLPFTVTALIADPAGNLRPLQISWATCATVDTNSRCETGATDLVALGSSVFQPTSISSEVSISVSLPEALLIEALGLGLTSVQIPVQITVTAGTETDVGVKYVVVSPYNEYEPTTPNHNPVFQALVAGGVDWSASSPPIFTSAEAGSSTTSGGGGFGRGGGGGGASGGVAVDPEMDAGAEYFVRYAADGVPSEYEEQLQFQFYTTMGAFNPETTGHGGSTFIPYPDAGPDAGGFVVTTVDAGPDAGPPTRSYWTATSGQAAQTVTFWVVVEDGRGGVDWVERTAQYAP